MYLIRGIGNLSSFKSKFPNQVMSGTIGNFDGFLEPYLSLDLK